jgi:uncharacterized protein YgbK (DUF1537 family)
MPQVKIIVFDDSASGAHAAPGCLLLSRWDIESLRFALLDDAPLFFILTQTRLLDAEATASRVREAALALRRALHETGVHPLIISRGDCALRGHHEVETRVLAEVLGPVDAQLIVPEMPDAVGQQGNGAASCATQASALSDIGNASATSLEARVLRDTLYASRYLFLAEWLSEQDAGRSKPDDVRHITLGDMRAERTPFAALSGGVRAIVDTDSQTDLARLTHELQSATQAGRRFLLRAGAPLVATFAQGERGTHRTAPVWHAGPEPGIVMTGVLSSRSLRQVEALCAEPGIQRVEIVIEELLDDALSSERRALSSIESAHDQGRTAVLVFKSAVDDHAVLVNAALTSLSRRLARPPGFLILKGAAAAQHVLIDGLGVAIARILGEILPGATLARLPAGQTAFPGLPVVFVPDEAGNDRDLVALHQKMTTPRDAQRRVLGA